MLSSFLLFYLLIFYSKVRNSVLFWNYFIVNYFNLKYVMVVLLLSVKIFNNYNKYREMSIRIYVLYKTCIRNVSVEL